MSEHHITWLPVKSGVFDFYLGRELLGRSRHPFTDAARLLLASGVAAASDKLTGGPTDDRQSLSCSVGTASKLTVAENVNFGPKFVKWQPYFRGDVNDRT